MKFDHPRALELLRTGAGDPETEFRPGQEEAIAQTIQAGARMLVVQRTGWGKSFVYFIAAKLLRESGHGPALLVSPLLALMRNQIEAAGRMGVVAERQGELENEGASGGDSESESESTYSSATNRHPESKNPFPYHDNGDESDSAEQGTLDRWLRSDEDREAARYDRIVHRVRLDLDYEGWVCLKPFANEWSAREDEQEWDFQVPR